MKIEPYVLINVSDFSGGVAVSIFNLIKVDAAATFNSLLLKCRWNEVECIKCAVMKREQAFQ